MSEADKHLLKLIRDGDPGGWSQFVARFQVRLLAYAVRQVDQNATAEDLVQDTFIGFLQTIQEYREQCELESYLFQILRRRIVDHYRRLGQNREIPSCQFRTADSESEHADPMALIPGNELSASTYARRNERQQQDETALATAISLLVSELRDAEKFRDLKIAEGLFYAQRRSVDLARLIMVSENEIAVVKHRLIERLARAVRKVLGVSSSESADTLIASDILTSVWETMRPSCPERTTLGKYTLRILPENWDDFVRFHIETLGCTFCSANLADLQTTSESPVTNTQHKRFFDSTIGLLNQR